MPLADRLTAADTARAAARADWIQLPRENVFSL